LTGIAEIAVGEAIEKAETSDSVKSRWDRRNAGGREALGKSKTWKLHGNLE